MREVRTFRARKHPNILKLFASFSTRREDPWPDDDNTPCLHLVFEHTPQPDMENWLKRSEARGPRADRDECRRHIMESIKCLVEAVAFLHETLEDTRAYHHDIKPANILVFERPVWKICEFGMAILKDRRDESGTTHDTKNGFGTNVY
jgi:serine/threonine protein kinase